MSDKEKEEAPINKDEFKGALSQIKDELSNIKNHLYINDDSMVVRLNACEKQLDALDTKYMIFNAEDKKGQWRLLTLLATTLLGWVSQGVYWLINYVS